MRNRRWYERIVNVVTGTMDNNPELGIFIIAGVAVILVALLFGA